MDETGIEEHEVWTFIFKNTNVHVSCNQVVFYNDLNFGNILQVYIAFIHLLILCN